MFHHSFIRKITVLSGVFLLGLFFMAHGAAVFTQGPTVLMQGDSAVLINFTVSEATDVEVSIIDGSGKVINHLAAGVLNGKYAPPEPLDSSLTQTGLDNSQ